MQNMPARHLCVGDVLESGELVTRISRGPGTFHTTYWTDAGDGRVVSDATTLRIRDMRDA